MPIPIEQTRENALTAIATAFSAEGLTVNSNMMVEGFTPTPSIVQTLNEKIRAENSVLMKVNVKGVKSKRGQKLSIGTGANAISRRTKLTGDKERKARYPGSLEHSEYELHKTETDYSVPDVILEEWAHVDGKVAQKIQNQVKITIAEERVKIGWNGVEAKEETDPSAKPMLEDLNKGWLQKVREENASGHFTEVRSGTGEIVVGVKDGVTSDHANVNALVASLKRSIPKHLRKDLVVLVGEDIADYHEDQIYSKYGEQPTEAQQKEMDAVMGKLGGLPWETPDFFPEDAILITSWDNLSIYYQTESWKKQSYYSGRREQWEDYNKRNEGYVLENSEKTALAENIVFAKDKAAS